MKGLYGCTGVVVVSECGAYMTYIWKTIIRDSDYKSNRAVFVAAAEDPLKGILNVAA